MALKIEHLRVFVDLSKTLSFTKTARQAGVTQPAVSKIVDSLENNLGVKLVIRNNKVVRFTQEGHAFAQQIESVLLAYDNAVSQVKVPTRSITRAYASVTPRPPTNPSTFPN